MQTVTILTPEAIDSFRSSLSDRGRSENTTKAYCADLNTLLRDLQVSAIPMSDFETVSLRWLTQYRKIVSPKTTGRRLTSLRAFAKWARWSCPDLNDYSTPTPPKGQPHPLPEGIDGVRRMLAVARPGPQRALIALCGLCGMRVAEALSIRPSSFDFNDMLVTIRGKGDKTRRVPVSDEAWEAMYESISTAFCTGNDELLIGFRDRNARALITRLGRAAGLRRHVASHDLRATFATAVYDKTRDQRLVQELLGHANGSTTEIYIGVTMAKMKEAVKL